MVLVWSFRYGIPLCSRCLKMRRIGGVIEKHYFETVAIWYGLNCLSLPFGEVREQQSSGYPQMFGTIVRTLESVRLTKKILHAVRPCMPARKF